MGYAKIKESSRMSELVHKYMFNMFPLVQETYFIAAVTVIGPRLKQPGQTRIHHPSIIPVQLEVINQFVHKTVEPIYTQQVMQRSESWFRMSELVHKYLFNMFPLVHSYIFAKWKSNRSKLTFQLFILNQHDLLSLPYILHSSLVHFKMIPHLS